MNEPSPMSIVAGEVRAKGASGRSSPVPPRKALASIFGFLLLGATLAPITQNWRPQPRDSFPFSYYPMFSAKRGDTYVVSYMVGLDGQGVRHTIPFWFAGSGGQNETRRQIDRLVREGKAALLCQDVAHQVKWDAGPLYSRMVTVQILTGEFRFDDYFNGNKTPVKKQIRASCQVARTEQTREVNP